MLKLNKFIKDQRGAVFIIIAFTFVSMVGLTAASIDFARGSLLKSELIASMDAAGLAGGTVANSPNMTNMVNKYFNVNLPNGYMSSTIDPLSITLAADKATLDVTGSAHLNNSMMHILGWNVTNIAAQTEVTMERKGMELVLVLDNTGSMSASAGGGLTKMDALRNASKELINILYGNKDELETLWVGLVPFSQAVNVGTGRTSWVDTATYNWGTTSWGGCVEAREASSRDMTDDPPSVARFPKYYSACKTPTSSYQSWWNSWFGTNSSNGSYGNPRYSNCSTSSGRQYRSPLGITLGPNQYCIKPMTQMVSTKQTILDAIDAMEQSGDTHINLGLVWGWRMLSPRWRGLWGGQMNTDSLPLDYNTPLMNKVIILLSDGDNSFVGNNYTAYGSLAEGNLGTTNSSTAAGVLNTRTTNLCNTLKQSDKNILIYTVALGSSISSTGKNLLRNCASKPEYYFESPTGDDLRDDFKTIGDSLSNLRISK